MANENKDVLRVFVLDASLNSTILQRQLGFATDTFEMAVKFPGGTVKRYAAQFHNSTQDNFLCNSASVGGSAYSTGLGKLEVYDAKAITTNEANVWIENASAETVVGINGKNNNNAEVKYLHEGAAKARIGYDFLNNRVFMGRANESGFVYLDLANNRMGVGTNAPARKVEIQSAGAQLRIAYDGSNFMDANLDSSGNLVMGTNAGGSIDISGTNFDTDAGNMTMTGGYIEVVDVSAPVNPGAGKGRLYKKTGNDGLFWKPDAAGGEVDLTPVGGAPHTGYAFGAGTTNDVSTGSASYATMSSILFPGSSIVGTPSSIKITGYQAGTSASFRIVDITNGQVIVTLTGITDVAPTKIIDLGALANIPAAAAVWELQGLRVGGGNVFHVSSLTITY